MPTLLRRGFTLIELLIAMALGMVLCLTAYAAVRVASQTVSRAENLALENRLYRASVFEALEQLDFWRCYDDPDPAGSNHKLRSDPVTSSAPFQPMTFDASNDPSDPKSWWRGLATGVYEQALAQPTYSHLGDYSLAGNLYDARPNGWYAKNFAQVNNTLGHYGLLDYLPANAIYSYYGDADGPQYMPDEFMPMCSIPDTGPYPEPYLWVNAPGWTGDEVGGLLHALQCAVFGVVTNDYLLGIGANRGGWVQDPDVGSNSHDWDKWTTFLNAGAAPVAFAGAGAGGTVTTVMDDKVKPAHWPSASLEVYSFADWGLFQHYAVIRLFNPVTGTSTKRYVYAPSTTLRGARQQRGLDLYASY